MSPGEARPEDFNRRARCQAVLSPWTSAPMTQYFTNCGNAVVMYSPRR